MVCPNEIPKIFSTDVLKELVEKYGTSDGTKRAWDARGRGRKEDPKTGKPDKGEIKDPRAQIHEHNNKKEPEPGNFVNDETAKTIFDHTAKNGGGTFSFDKEGKAVPLTEGIAVAENSDLGGVLETKGATDGDVKAYMERNKDELQKPGKFLGTWNNPEDGKSYYDISTVYPENQLETAKQSGTKNNQIGVFNIRTSEFIACGGTGEVPKEHDKTQKSYSSIGALGFYDQ